MSRQLIIAMLAAVMPALLGGCGNESNVSAERDKSASLVPELAPKALPLLPDLPVPMGFKLKEGSSRAFRSASGARYADLVYQGKDDKFSVGRFFRKQMPVSRWTLEKDLFVQGDVILGFTKETERCDVTISDSAVLWLFKQTTIEAQIWSTGKIVAPIQEP